jgi:hypothetical protein
MISHILLNQCTESSDFLCSSHYLVKCWYRLVILWCTHTHTHTRTRTRTRAHADAHAHTRTDRCVQYGRQPHMRKSIWFWDKKLRTTGSLLGVKSPRKTQTSEENVNHITLRGIAVKCAQINSCCLLAVMNSTFNSAWCATQKAPPKSVQDSNDACTETEWPSSTHRLHCGYARKNLHFTWFPPPSVLLHEATFHVSGVVNRYNCMIWGVKIHMSHVSWREAALMWMCGPP